MRENNAVCGLKKEVNAMADMSQLGGSLIEPLGEIWSSFVQTLPGILGALVVLIIGYLIANLVSKLLNKLFSRTKIDRILLEKTRVKRVLGDFQLTTFVAQLMKWYIFVWFLPPAAALSNLQPLSTFLVQLSLWIPNAIVAVLTAFFGLTAAEYCADLVQSTRGKGSDVLAGATKVIILVFTALIVLDQIGIAVSVARNSFLIVLGGIMLALALALGIGFGLGLKDEAKAIVKEVRRNL